MVAAALEAFGGIGKFVRKGSHVVMQKRAEGTTITVRIPVPAKYGKLLTGGGEGRPGEKERA